MRNDDRAMVNWFKGELRSYLNSQKVLENLERRIQTLDNKLEYHSPDLSGNPHGNSAPHDEQLANYITMRDRFMKQYDSNKARQEAVESILSAIPESESRIIIRISKGITTMESEGRKIYRSKNEIQGMIDRSILKAVKKYLAGDGVQ
jgi:hypothetical protein